jgi:hypothetical protein
MSPKAGRRLSANIALNAASPGATILAFGVARSSWL